MANLWEVFFSLSPSSDQPNHSHFAEKRSRPRTPAAGRRRRSLCCMHTRWRRRGSGGRRTPRCSPAARAAYEAVTVHTNQRLVSLLCLDDLIQRTFLSLLPFQPEGTLTAPTPFSSHTPAQAYRPTGLPWALHQTSTLRWFLQRKGENGCIERFNCLDLERPKGLNPALALPKCQNVAKNA